MPPKLVQSFTNFAVARPACFAPAPCAIKRSKAQYAVADDGGAHWPPVGMADDCQKHADQPQIEVGELGEHGVVRCGAMGRNENIDTDECKVYSVRILSSRKVHKNENSNGFRVDRDYPM